MKRRIALPIALIVTLGVMADDGSGSFVTEPPSTAITQIVPAASTVFIDYHSPTVSARKTASIRSHTPDKVKRQSVAFIPAAVTQIALLTATYEWGNNSKQQTEQLQKLLNIAVDGNYGRQTLSAHAEALEFLGLPTNNLPSPPAPGRRFPETSRCENVEAAAAAAGWPQTEIRTLSYVAYRESRCNPSAYNGKGRDRSYGLVQINTKGSLWEHRRDLCGLNAPEDLFITEVNLSCAYRLWARSGWAPWNM